ncbi:hypothetical protein L596_011309 [Steinernema carpocapsae]|uniref:C2H2-type domain-containing protein n=1 Tax=Steinernema carpocapsae TaxID=34508 RepID=A0A4U5NUF9_STECR|nr:hypothetical protein L596_011309 [Steinernema carpocapsae]
MSASPESSHECQQCGKIFDKSWRLRTHMNGVHLKIRPYTCMFCSSGFRSPHDLRRHMTIHTGERFTCDGCGLSFGSKQRVADHLIRSEKCWPRGEMPPAASRSESREEE